ncbi:hypothetical protein V8F33_013134 [Rhypophila sp. PSN 637]
MTTSLLLSRPPQGTSLIKSQRLSNAIGVGLRSGRRLSCISSHTSTIAPPTQHQTKLSHSQQLQPTLKGIRPQISSSSTRWNIPVTVCSRNFTTTKRSTSSTTTTTNNKNGSAKEGKQTSSSPSIANDETTRRKEMEYYMLLAFFGATIFHYLLYAPDEDGNQLTRDPVLEWLVGRPLNSQSFVPFTIVAREQVSPTSFVITVRPKYARDPAAAGVKQRWRSWLPDCFTELHSNRGRLQKAWDYGLWSVEFKQPQLQVAREYTPLPSPYGQEEEDLEAGRLRFLIRRMEGGEVSSYLAGLKVGDVVELRGPHFGFDVRRRLGQLEDPAAEGENRKVVFLAGGTGIAPALQVVRALLDGNGRGGKPEVRIVWANRHRADCVGCEGVSTILNPGIVENLRQGNGKNAVLSFLAEARARHGDKLKYACSVDEEGAFIDATSIAGATGMSSLPSSSASGGFFSSIWGGEEGKAPVSSKPTREDEEQQDGGLTCQYHSAKLLRVTDGSEDSLLSSPKKSDTKSTSQNNTLDNSPRQSSKEGTAATCQCDPSHKGKNLLMASGPDGFISTFVGPKIWANGKELQGPVRGVVGNELRKKDERFWRDWLVLKM